MCGLIISRYVAGDVGFNFLIMACGYTLHCAGIGISPCLFSMFLAHSRLRREALEFPVHINAIIQEVDVQKSFSVPEHCHHHLAS